MLWKKLADGESTSDQPRSVTPYKGSIIRVRECGVTILHAQRYSDEGDRLAVVRSVISEVFGFLIR